MDIGRRDPGTAGAHFVLHSEFDKCLKQKLQQGHPSLGEIFLLLEVEIALHEAANESIAWPYVC